MHMPFSLRHCWEVILWASPGRTKEKYCMSDGISGVDVNQRELMIATVGEFAKHREAQRWCLSFSLCFRPSLLFSARAIQATGSCVLDAECNVQFLK